MLDHHSIEIRIAMISRGGGGGTERLGDCIEAWQDSVDESLCIHVRV